MRTEFVSSSRTFPLGYLSALFCASLLGLQPVLTAERPRWSTPAIQADGSVLLYLTNAAGASYTIQTSSNLLSWFAAGSGLASNGVLVFQHSGPANHRSLFYRAVENPPTLPVVPVPDTNAYATTLVTADGGRCQIYTDGDLHVQLVVPPMTLPHPTLVTMSLVTNLSGLPFSGGALLAVHVEPETLLLWGAAQLEFTLPPGIDRPNLVAYRFQMDGTRFTPVPCLLLTNRLRVAITEFGGYGFSLATPEEMASFIEGAMPVRPLYSPPKVELSAASQDCHGAKKEIATSTRRQLEGATDRVREAVTRQLSAIRQQQAPGYETDAQSTLTQALGDSCVIYEQLIAPRWSEATQNCALAEVLIQFTLGMERQRQLLGAAEEEGCTSSTPALDCSLIRNCVEELRECCETVQGPGKVVALLGLARKDAVLGTECISEQLLEETTRQCSSNMWIGTFEARSMISEQTGDTGYRTNLEHEVLFAGSVAESVEMDFGVAGKIVELVVHGTYSGRDYNAEISSGSSRCLNGNTSTWFTMEEVEVTLSKNSTYNVTLSIETNGTYKLLGAHFDSPQLPYAPAKGYHVDYSRSQNCSGEISIRNTRQDKRGYFYGPTTPISESKGQTNRIEGKHSFVIPGDTPQTISFKWNFRSVSGLGP
jgi:hypothetical protein